jgi:hypothetical protein
MKRVFIGCIFVALVLLNFIGCATMIHTSQANVVAASGTSVPVEVLDNGMPVYKGNLPATFPVKSGHSYTVIYTSADGEKRTMAIGEKFNGWFIGSLFLGLLPAVVDLATGNIMQVEKATTLPISYSPMIYLGENLVPNSNVQLIGNMYDLNLE